VNNATFLLNVHFCNSRFPIFSRIVANGSVVGRAFRCPTAGN
jgi:hypothetical protein